MKRMIALLLALLLCLSLSACGGGADKQYGATDTAGDYDNTEPAAPMQSEEMSASVDMADRKLIYNASVTAETKEFDQSKNDLDQLIEKHGGFIQSSSISGDSYENSREQKRLEYTLRVPAESLFTFLEELEDVARVISCDTNMDDVTGSYVDTEARLSALRQEEKKLLELLDEAANLTEILELEDRISQVRYEIESMTAQLKSYDNQIEYSTVTIYLRDVTDYTVRPSFGSRSYDAFVGGWTSFVNALQSLVIGLLNLWPFLVVLVIVVVIVVFCVKRSTKKSRAKFQASLPIAQVPQSPADDPKGKE